MGYPWGSGEGPKNYRNFFFENSYFFGVISCYRVFLHRNVLKQPRLIDFTLFLSQFLTGKIIKKNFKQS